MKALSSGGTLHRRPLFRSAHAALVLALSMCLAIYAIAAAPTARAADSLLSQGKTATASSVENAGTAGLGRGRRQHRHPLGPARPATRSGSRSTSAGPRRSARSCSSGRRPSGKAYQIQTSNDGSAWTPVYSTTTGPGGTETLNVTGSGRYIRMYGTARNTGYGYSLWEFQVYGTMGTGGGTCGTQNAALNQPATASSTENAGTPDRPRPSTATPAPAGPAPSADPQWLEVNLGSTSQPLCQVVPELGDRVRARRSRSRPPPTTRTGPRSTRRPPGPAACRR